MEKISLHRLGTLCPVIVTFMATILWGSLSAQESDNLLTIRIIEVASGKTNEFVDLQRELAEARKEAGMEARWVWQEVRGNTNVFHIVTASENFAEEDESSDPVLGEAGWAKWISRITQTIKSREVMTLRLYPDLEIELKEGQQPNLLLLNEYTVEQGKTGEFRQWLRDSMTPLLKKAGVSGRSFGRTVYGGSVNKVFAARHYSSWAELDEPGPLSTLSDEEREELWASSPNVVLDIKRTILRFRADLSHDGPE